MDFRYGYYGCLNARREFMMEDEVRIIGYDLKQFYDELDENQKNLFFTLLAVGKTGLFARDYIDCISRDPNIY